MTDWTDDFEDGREVTDGQCAVWDIRFGSHYPEDFKPETPVVYSKALKRVIEVSEVCELLREYCKAWVFQVERAPTTGLLHFQARVSLFKKLRLPQLKEEMDDTVFKGAKLLPTSNNGRSGPAFWNYCSKRPTRVLGPWDSKTDFEPPKMTKQLETYYLLQEKPWMKTVKSMMKVYDERHIDMIIQEIGNKAKTVFVEALEFEECAFQVPPCRLLQEIMEFVLASRKQRAWKAYCIDLPKALKKDKMSDFFAGIECLKNGMAYDRRYSAKRIRFDRPNVWIFFKRNA